MGRLFPICLLMFAMPGVARVHAAGHDQRILWIGAHPDDEALVAPLLGPDGAAAILVITRGENGHCVLPGGCGSDLGSLRAAEMSRAAALLHAHLTLWNFSDVDSAVDATWSAEAGGHAELVRRIASVIVAERTTVVYTFDPNHGSTCHPAHLAAGALTMEAAAQTGVRVMFLETAAVISPGGFAFRAAIPGAVPFDTTQSWSWLVQDAEEHASQFTPEQVEELQAIPAAERRVWLSAIPAATNLCALPNWPFSIHDSRE